MIRRVRLVAVQPEADAAARRLLAPLVGQEGEVVEARATGARGPEVLVRFGDGGTFWLFPERDTLEEVP